jgi:hypothetical protein
MSTFKHACFPVYGSRIGFARLKHASSLTFSFPLHPKSPSLNRILESKSTKWKTVYVCSDNCLSLTLTVPTRKERFEFTVHVRQGYDRPGGEASGEEKG